MCAGVEVPQPSRNSVFSFILPLSRPPRHGHLPLENFFFFLLTYDVIFKILYLPSICYRKSHRVIKSRSSEQFVTPSRSGHTCNSPSGKLKSPSHTDVNNQETLPCSPKVTTVSKSNLDNLLGEDEQQNSKKSSLNLPADSYCYNPNTSRQDGVTEVTTPKVYTPLTKKKWLESSDPGLFGSTASEKKL